MKDYIILLHQGRCASTTFAKNISKSVRFFNAGEVLSQRSIMKRLVMRVCHDTLSLPEFLSLFRFLHFCVGFRRYLVFEYKIEFLNSKGNRSRLELERFVRAHEKKCVVIFRRDVQAHLVSSAIAKSTGRWHAGDRKKNKSVPHQNDQVWWSGSYYASPSKLASKYLEELDILIECAKSCKKHIEFEQVISEQGFREFLIRHHFGEVGSFSVEASPKEITQKLSARQLDTIKRTADLVYNHKTYIQLEKLCSAKD